MFNLSKEEFGGLFVITMAILAILVIFDLMPCPSFEDMFFNHISSTEIMFRILGFIFVTCGIIFFICTCIYTLIKKYKTKNYNPSIITVKRKFYLNQMELIVLIGTICTISIPFIVLWQCNNNLNEFLTEGSKLLSDIIENPAAFIMLILMISTFFGVVGISLFMFIRNAFNFSKIDSIKSMSFDTYAKQISICYRTSRKVIDFDDIDTLLLNIQTVKIPKIRPGVYKTAIRNDALGGFAKSIVATDFATNNNTAVYEVEIVLKTIKNKEYKISVSTNSFFDPNSHTLFEQLVKCKRYFNFEYKFIGPVILYIERILKK